MADLIEELGVIQQRPAQNNDVAQYHPDMGQHEGASRTRCDWLIVMWQSDVEPGGDEKCEIQPRIHATQTAAVPNVAAT